LLDLKQVIISEPLDPPSVEADAIIACVAAAIKQSLVLLIHKVQPVIYLTGAHLMVWKAARNVIDLTIAGKEGVHIVEGSIEERCHCPFGVGLFPSQR